MNTNIHTRLILLLSILCGVFSCSSSDRDINLSSLFGLQFQQGLPWLSESGSEFARDFWNGIQEETLIKTDADKLNWCPVYSGSRTGVLLRVEGQFVKEDSMDVSLRYKGEKIYELKRNCYAFSRDGVLYISNFPTSLQKVIVQGNLKAAEETALDLSQGLKYWSGNFDGLSNTNQYPLYLNERGDWLMSGVDASVSVDDSFLQQCHSIKKADDSYLYLPLKRKTDEYMVAEGEIQRMLLWREKHLLAIYDNTSKPFEIKGGQIADSKTIYGIADIYKLKKPWSIQLGGELSQQLSDSYVFEWENLFMVCDDIRLLESVLSYLILDEPLSEQINIQEGEFAYIRLAHFSEIFSDLIGSTAFPKVYLPSSGAYSIHRDSSDIKFKYRSESKFPQPLLYQAEIGAPESNPFICMGPLGELMIFNQSGKDGHLKSYDKFGKEMWSIPVKDSIRSFQSSGAILMVEMEGQYRFVDLETRLLFEEVLPIKKESIQAGLISYPDRSTEEYKVWQQDSFGNIELKTLAAEFRWFIEANLLDSMINTPSFLPRDTSDHLIYYNRDSLFAFNLDGKALFAPIDIESVPQELPVNYLSSNMVRTAFAMSNGKVKVVNMVGGHFNLFLLSGMRDFFLTNVNTGPNPEFVAYSDREINVKGYVREAFKSFSKYKSDDYIKDVLHCESPQGTFFAVLKEGQVEILDNTLEVKTAFPIPLYDEAYFYFSPVDASMSLVLKDKNRILVFLLEELV